MSCGSISIEAHEAIAVAMNTIGHKVIVEKVERMLLDLIQLKIQN